MKVLPIKTTPLIDVFTGEGWENWTRLLYKNKVLIPLSGEVLNKNQLEEVKQHIQRLNPKPSK